MQNKIILSVGLIFILLFSCAGFTNKKPDQALWQKILGYYQAKQKHHKKASVLKKEGILLRKKLPQKSVKPNSKSR